MDSKTIAFTGSHSTGKTYAATNEMLHLKFNNPGKSVHALCDLEVFCPYPINKDTTEKSQMWLFGNQIREELAASARFDIVVTDRTVVDVIAYTYAAEFWDLAQNMLCYAQHHIKLYETIRFKTIGSNDHLHPDGIRDTDPVFRQTVEDLLSEFYTQLLDDNQIKGGFYYV